MKVITVISSLELTLQQKEKLEQGIFKKEKTKNINFNYIIDNIVGGIVVLDHENMIDASYLNTFKRLKTSYEDYLSQSKQGIMVKDIPSLIKQKTSDVLQQGTHLKSYGKVMSVSDGIVKISGLPECKLGEVILIGDRGFALSMNLERDSIGAILLSEEGTVEYGNVAYCSGKILEVPVGVQMLGRVIDPLGNAIDGLHKIDTTTSRKIEFEAPRIIDRDQVKEPLNTGILAIDSMVPIGKGQRELIIGDRQTGKSSIAINTIINQKGKNVFCVYVAIGQRASVISNVISTLKRHGALEYTVVVLSTAADSASLQYIAPYTGTAIAEHFMYAGKDALIIYDDLSKHAVSYRTLSLLLKRPAGREAYPGDVFYIHSKLLERSAKLSKAMGAGSLTALPIVETQEGDISAYIPTNIISITDGQIYLERELFNSGQRPAVNVGLSVSRVGGAAQSKIMRRLSSKLRLDLTHYRELSAFSQFGISLDKQTKSILENGEKIEQALKQGENLPLSVLQQEIYLFAIVNGYLNNLPLAKIKEFLEKYYNHVHTYLIEKFTTITELADVYDHIEEELKELTEQFVISFMKAG